MASAVGGFFARKLGSAVAGSAKNAAIKMARNQAMAAKQAAIKRGQQYAANMARRTANEARRRVNAGITQVVNRHLGNNANSRALANKLKANALRRINAAHNATKNQIKRGSSWF